MLVRMGAKFQAIRQIDDLAQIMAALNLVFDFTEYLPDFILNRVRPVGLGLEQLQVGKNKFFQIIAAAGRMMINFTRPINGSRPRLPSIEI